MNSLFNSALKQSSAVRRDLDALTEAPINASPALQGQVSASLASLSRTVDEYQTLAKQELVAAKQEKALARLKTFRADLAEYRDQLDRLKRDREQQETTINRHELLGRRPHHSSTPENPYAHATESSPFRPSSSDATALGASPADQGRESQALREHSFMAATNAQLDDFLDRGRAVLGDLGQQRALLKGTQKRLYSVAATLGVSGETIRMVERRASQDRWIFAVGVLVFLALCYLALRWLR
ncbi:MAG: protein transport protein bos1 [Phylliscum demangeonii]|nr:MAG: protein transport protein bos1 [Phylliscum demangeonii]